MKIGDVYVLLSALLLVFDVVLSATVFWGFLLNI